MSSEWVKAGKYWHGYSELVYSASGKSRHLKPDKLPSLETVSTSGVSKVITRATMRELCLISHDSGLVMVSHTELARRLGVSYHSIKRAIKRLTDDGYLVLIRRGSGSRMLPNRDGVVNARVNAYLIARLPDEYGIAFPTPAVLEKAFMKLVKSPRYLGFNEEHRREIARQITEFYEFE